MSDFNSRNKRSGGSRYSNNRGFGRRDSGRREMHSAVCDNCGKNCEVPFRPTGDKPVLCSDCFEKKDGGNFRKSDFKNNNRREFSKPDNTNRLILDQLVSLNAKIDRLVKALEPDQASPATDETLLKEKVESAQEQEETLNEKPKTRRKTTSKIASK